MKKLTKQKVKQYFLYRSDDKLLHCPEAIANACNSMANDFSNHEFADVDALDLMRLLLLNTALNGKGIPTHSYGFHTATGRAIINKLQMKYYEYKR